MSVRPILALIPARGGSKSIPRKNLLPLNGKPLIAYSIEQALASRHITRVIVSTDDEEIAAVSRSHGAEVPFLRPSEFARDSSTDLEVFRHALQWLADTEQFSCECVVHLRPTGPVRRVEVIDRAIDTFLARPDADSLRSVTAPAQSPYKMWRRNSGFIEPLVPVANVVEAHSAPRQSLPEVFWQCGYVDIVRPSVVLDRGMMAGTRVLPFVVHEPIYELDYPDQIEAVAEALRRLAAGETFQDAPQRHPV